MSNLPDDINPDSLVDVVVDIPVFMTLRVLAGKARDLADHIGHAELRAIADQMANVSLVLEQQAVTQGYRHPKLVIAGSTARAKGFDELQ